MKMGVKKLLSKDYRGPQAVIASMQRGLDEYGVDYVFNKAPAGNMNVACVLTGQKTLRWACEQKRNGTFQTIIAGPDVGMPDSPNNPVLTSAVDRYIVPSPWVLAWIKEVAPLVAEKTRVWASGVQTQNLDKAKKRNSVIIYKKFCKDSTYKKVVQYLEAKNIS